MSSLLRKSTLETVFRPFPSFLTVSSELCLEVLPPFRSENSLNIKCLGGIFLGHPAPKRRDIPDKNFMQLAFFCCFTQRVAWMSRDLGRDVPDLEKLYARKLRADFSYPIYYHARRKSVSQVLFQRGMI